ncbi:uncharacterized protein LOC117292916 [Asterias rubens]|uniref:uncharacterized protein LOC117292916 n=1 Tax=Asterias rubens TaxID=7604 RepID=UPI001455063E|nr:uncharacterized protein LOC117292916 [Asterias rubens]
MDSSDDCHVRLVNPCESSRPWYGGKPDWKTADEDESNRRSADPLDQTVLATNTQRWPSFIWFLLKLIGLYNFRPAVAKRRLCVRCHHAATERRCVVRGEGVPRYLCFGATEVTEREDELFQFMVNDEADQGEGVIRFNLPAEEPCPVCRCEWWDAHGNYRPYTDAEIGVRCWNHYGSGVVSTIFQFLLIVLNLIDFFYYLDKYWGCKDKKVDLVIFSGFVFFVISIPTICLVANIINLIPSLRQSCWKYSWTNALNIRYIVKRLQHLELANRGLPNKAFLVICLAWPILNSVWRCFIYFVFLGDSINFHIISLVASTLSMSIWGAFCYLMVLMRLSFLRQFKMELRFLWNHIDALDRCRQRLAVCMEEFGSLGSLVSNWVMFTIAIATWAFSTQIYYDYATHVDHRTNLTLITVNESSGFDILDITGNLANSTLAFATRKELDRLIWSEICMFLILPLVAVGGLDLNSQWVKFRQQIGELRLVGKVYDEFYDKILAFCTEHPPVKNIETMTLLVSTLGLCLAIEFNDREEFSLLNHHH